MTPSTRSRGSIMRHRYGMTLARERAFRPLLVVGLPTFLRNLLCAVRGLGDGLVHALFAGHGGVEFRADVLDRLLGARSVGQGSGVLEYGLNRLVVVYAEALLPHLLILHDAFADGRAATGDAGDFLLRARDPADEGPSGFLVRRVRRYAPIPGAEHRFAAWDLGEAEVAS